MRLSFLGAAGTVTGSRYLVEAQGQRILVDCGLFQGLKDLRLKNREPFPVDPKSLDAVVLTHAHLDHSGYIPRLCAEGFSGPIYCTPSTLDLCRILLLDSASIMEEEADHARHHGYSRHKPPMPLYTVTEATRSLGQLRSASWERPLRLPAGLEITFRKAGHILGAASTHIRGAGVEIAFSGDLGRPHDPIFGPPQPPGDFDYLTVESTYGDRKHENVDPVEVLAEALRDAVRKRSVVVVPAFAVGRTQMLLHQLWTLKNSGRLPPIPIYVDSPMASDVTRLYMKHPGDHLLGGPVCREVFSIARYVQTTEESKTLSARSGPMLLISASGMATGGRVLHHLKSFAPNPDNLILLTGFQAEGTRGARLAAGEDSIKIHGDWIPVRAAVKTLPNVSAHADGDEMLEWLRKAPRAPRRVFITHGEPSASAALRDRIEKELGWPATVPAQGDAVELLPAK